MHPIVRLTLVASVLSWSTTSFAQSACDPVTRAQVRAELVRLEQAGYQPAAGDDPYYPEDIQAAEAKVAREEAQHASAMPSTLAAGVASNDIPGGANCARD